MIKEQKRGIIELKQAKVCTVEKQSNQDLTVVAFTATHYGRFCSVIEIHKCIGRSDCYSGRNGAITAVTACYAPLRNGSNLILSKKHKKKKLKIEEEG